MGDFAALVDLPDMYLHCKATEDKDMTPFDFITDHLINIDGIFDKHDNGDEQKPHNPPPFQHHGQVNFAYITYYELTFNQSHLVNEKVQWRNDDFILSEYIIKIFHPPIA